MEGQVAQVVVGVAEHDPGAIDPVAIQVGGPQVIQDPAHGRGGRLVEFQTGAPVRALRPPSAASRTRASSGRSC